MAEPLRDTPRHNSGAKPEAKRRRKQPPPTAASLANLAPPFKAGAPSANPSGRPRTPPELRLRALQAAPDALQVAIAVVENARDAQAEFGRAKAEGKPLAAIPCAYPDTHVRWAVETVLDRALGKPDVAVSLAGDSGGALASVPAAMLPEFFARLVAEFAARPALPDVAAIVTPEAPAGAPSEESGPRNAPGAPGPATTPEPRPGL